MRAYESKQMFYTDIERRDAIQRRAMSKSKSQDNAAEDTVKACKLTKMTQKGQGSVARGKGRIHWRKKGRSAAQKVTHVFLAERCVSNSNGGWDKVR